ncbi:sterol desaturase family protein [Mangrovivirga sp. M17]|uniref:Sterol desaturase family protein n=1 Tax=Mangrovivirga halotolerans TaxID=2993936 RepID=A0ABT3RW42_9BACT|nr:sterol desaturase family protein [Mangrovivirga halotolerans]MCX2746000.1 sterol desaturase family protein [Mangrovivirga halotolerans]
MNDNAKTGRKLDDNQQSAKMFDNPILERLRKSHIAVPISIFVIISIGLLVYAASTTSIPALTTIGLFLVGVFVFTLVEYVVHKEVYHAKTESILKEGHTFHHEYPKQKSFLAMPPIMSVITAVVLFLLFRLILNDYSFSFLAGFLMAYAGYLVIHAITHIYKPPKNFLKIWWKHHLVHHYNDKVNFGVTSPFWDHIFGTVDKK